MYEFSSEAAINFYYFNESVSFIEKLVYQHIVDHQEYSLDRLASPHSKKLVIEDIVVYTPTNEEITIKDMIEG